MIVAIDGPAGAGKSSVAQEVASRLGLQYIDTGAIYRAVAWFADDAGVSFDDGPAVAALADALTIRFTMRGGVNTIVAHLAEGPTHDLTDAIRTPHMSRGSSRVSAHPEVRDALLELQRRLGRATDSLLEGRDIGTVVFPAAEVKVYLTASPDVRAARRRDQMLERGGAAPPLEEIAAEIRERDHRDSSRPVAPLRPAPDATVIDTSTLSFEEAVEAIVALARRGAPAAP